MNKFASLAALVILPVLSVLFSTPVFADSPGQLSNGPMNYKVRNVTTNGAYGQTATATCDETVKYSITLSNSDFGQLKDLTVKANMATGDITASAVNAADATTSVSGNAKVTVDKGTLAYIPGSTVRISSDNTNREVKADGITSGGVNVGTLNGSTAIFVQFEAKVNCPVIVKEIKVCVLATKEIKTINEKDFDATKHSKNLADCAAKPPVPGEIVVCETATKKIVTIKENEFNESKYTKDLSKCAATPVVVTTTPTELPQTGATGVIAIVASVIAAAAGYAVTARKNLLG